MRKAGHRSVRTPAVALVWVMVLSGLLTACGGADDSPDNAGIEPARRGLTIGIAGNLRSSSPPERRRTSAQLRAAGFTMAREDFEWRRIEPRQGHFDWRRTDELVRDTAAEGLAILPLLNATPRWAGPSIGRMPRNRRTFATFVERVVARYASGGSFWRARGLDDRLAPRWFELYNEPYLERRGVEPAAYAAVVRAAVTRARAMNRRVRFLAAGETTAVGRDGRERPWLQALYEADPAFGDLYDALAVHPYSSGRPALRYTPGTNDARRQTRRVEEIRATMVRQGDADKKLWITEIGWSTCRGGRECVSRAAQAKYLVDVFDLVGGPWRSFVDAVFVYTARDYPTAPGDKEGAFGLLDRDGGAKPAWRALKRLARR